VKSPLANPRRVSPTINPAHSQWEVEREQAQLQAAWLKQPRVKSIEPELRDRLRRTEAVRQLLREWRNKPLRLYSTRGRSTSRRSFFYYKGSIWASSEPGLKDDDLRILCERKIVRDAAKLESLKCCANPKAFARAAIPEEVRLQVWRRDSGKCAKCGSRQNLEFDHIVPVSMGGSSTARNIELLCQDCNRDKGATVA
jgi:HNH endonuclease